MLGSDFLPKPHFFPLGNPGKNREIRDHPKVCGGGKLGKSWECFPSMMGCSSWLGMLRIIWIFWVIWDNPSQILDFFLRKNPGFQAQVSKEMKSGAASLKTPSKQLEKPFPKLPSFHEDLPAPADESFPVNRKGKTIPLFFGRQEFRLRELHSPFGFMAKAGNVWVSFELPELGNEWVCLVIPKG